MYYFMRTNKKIIMNFWKNESRFLFFNHQMILHIFNPTEKCKIPPCVLRPIFLLSMAISQGYIYLTKEYIINLTQ